MGTHLKTYISNLSFPPVRSGNIAATADDRGRGRGGAYDIDPREYLEEETKHVGEGGREGGREGREDK